MMGLDVQLRQQQEQSEIIDLHAHEMAVNQKTQPWHDQTVNYYRQTYDEDVPKIPNVSPSMAVYLDILKRHGGTIVVLPVAPASEFQEYGSANSFEVAKSARELNEKGWELNVFPAISIGSTDTSKEITTKLKQVKEYTGKFVRPFVKVHPILEKRYLANINRGVLDVLAGEDAVLYVHADHLAALDDKANRFSKPGEFEIVASTYPSLKIVAAHFGGEQYLKALRGESPGCWTDKLGKIMREHPNVYADTAGLALHTNETPKWKPFFDHVKNNYGDLANRVVSGTDFPQIAEHPRTTLELQQNLLNFDQALTTNSKLLLYR